MGGIVLVEGFVHEARTAVSLENLLHTPLLLGAVGGGERLHHHTHGPWLVEAAMGAAYSFTRLTAEEVGIVEAPHEAARILIDGVIDGHIGQIGQAEQAGCIGIVHQQGTSVAVNLESINLTVLGMLHHGIFLERQIHLAGHLLAFARQHLVVIDLAQDDGSLAEYAYSKEVAGYQIGEDGAVVRGTECTGDEAASLARMTIAGVAAGVVQSKCLATEVVVGLHPVPVLLVAECGEDSIHHAYPFLIEDAGITGA